ncbi:hypothetical protein [Desulfosarcina variabilis]|uniref:hypothetical protein n=1 Tax=Desulfosarcina variabilis TaxID=2300 RepID=UPI003AFB257F
MKHFSIWLVLLCLGSCFTACAPYQVNHKVVGNADLSQAKRFYIAHNPDDTTPLDVIIEAELNKQGFYATHGDKADLPEDTDILITYEFHWYWDFTNYLLQFEIELRDPNTGVPLARGESWRASLARRTPEEMANEILEPLLKPSSATE